MTQDALILARLDAAIARVEAAERAVREPIALVGLGCRFPGGADSPEAYWRLLANGVDAVGEIPRERFDASAYYDPEPGVAGKMYTREGAFIGAIDGFDADLFGIAPREAESLDPQQRLLVEVAWEALERAGQPWARHDGSATGVFLGVSNSDYARLLAGGDDLAAIGPYYLAGNLLSAMAGRIAYLLGLRGPALAVDTACSSSLVAVHLACQSLRSRECDLALAGGVSLMLSPETWVAGCQGRMLAPDGRSKTFAAGANGFGRGEGCGVVVLKRLSDAERDRDRIVAVIRGSAVNQDGASGGFSVPSGPAQQAVIRAALAQARIEPAAVSYVEAHGTGTALGDPIEMGALDAVYDAGRTRPLVVGSVKTNIGHLEAAAGIAGLIKVALALEHGEIPAHLHFHEPNPLIAWDRLAVEVPRAHRPWPVDGARVAGVSSFGFNGTNAHVVVSAAPAAAAAPPMPGPSVLVLSARSETALEALAERYEQVLGESRDDFADICATAAIGRRHFEHRLAIVAASAAGARDTLRARHAAQVDGMERGTAIGRARVAALFPGQGAQYAGMGGELLDVDPVRDIVTRCERALGDDLGVGLGAILRGEAGALEETALAQPALYALECGLWELWRRWGLGVSAVLGHSVGEYAAAYAAGVLELEDGARLVAARGRLMGARCRRGVMAAVLADVATVERAIAACGAAAEIAAENGPGATVVSGSADGVAAVERVLAGHGIASRRLAVSHAFHSALMEPMLAEYGAAIAAVKLRAPRLTFISSLTGASEGEAPSEPAYWVRQLRDRVRFGSALGALWGAAHRHYIEVGPGVTLVALGRAAAGAKPAVWAGGLRAGRPAWTSVLDALAKLHAGGAGIDWSAVVPGRRKVLLPTYPFARRRHWAAPSGARHPRPSPPPATTHPLLGRRVRSALKHREALFETTLALDTAHHGDHVVRGRALVPAASFVEMALAAGAALRPGEPLALENLAIVRPLSLAAGVEPTVQLVASPEADGAWSLEISSLDAGEWTLHATGRVLSAPDAPPPALDPSSLVTRLADRIDGASFYRDLREHGVEYGPAFQGVAVLHRDSGETLGRIRVPDPVVAELPGYTLHPAVLDACLQTIAGALPPGETWLQAGLARARVHGRAGTTLWSHARLRESPADTTIADVTVADERGAIVAELSGVVLRRARAEMLDGALDDLCYEVAWEPIAAPDDGALPPLATIVRRVREIDDGPGPVLSGLLAEMEAAAGDFVIGALGQLGAELAPGRRFTADTLASQVGVVAAHRRLLERLLEILAERGAVRRAAHGWECVAVPADVDARGRLDALAARYPEARDEIAMLARCGENLAPVLRGEIEPLALLFPEDGSVSAARLYLESSGARAMSRRVREVVAALVAGVAPDRRLRVLEIGAGTGGTTAAVLPVLPAERTEYVFTDVSPWFTSRAAERFRDHSFVTSRRYDVEQPPERQGIEAGRFDLVVAANVLHVVADLRATLATVSRLLAPGGILLVLEATRPLAWVDLIFGLTDGWWRFADHDVRARHPLVPAATWMRWLAEAGTADVATVEPARDDVELLSRQALVLAQRGVEPAGGRADWIVFGDRDVAPALEAALAGERCTRVVPGDTFARDPDGTITLDPLDAAGFRRVLDGVRARGIVWLWALDAPQPDGADPAARADADLPGRDDGGDLVAGGAGALARGTGGALHLFQALIDRAAPDAPSVWLVTRGAVTADTSAGGLAQSTLWGLARCAMAEHPDLGCRLMDLDPAWDAATAAAAVARALRAPSAEPLVALRASGPRAPRLVRHRAPPAPPLALRADATYLITGGLGSVGLLVAERLAARGARAVALVGRSTGSAASRARVDALRAAGVDVAVLAADVARHDELARALAGLADRRPPIRGVVHNAGVFDDRLVRDHRWALFEKVFAPKVLGALNLHRLTRTMPLDFFVMSSSASVLFAPPGMSNYVAANAFLDALAHHRRRLGLPALTIDWGLWRDVGMATQFSAERERQWARLGMRPMDADEALRALETLLAAPGAAACAVMRVEWAALAAQPPAGLPRGLFDTLLRGATASRGSVEPELRASLGAAAPGERAALLRAHVRQQVARVLGLPSVSAVDPRRGFFEAGMDSLTSLELRNALQTSLGCVLPTTIAFKYPTVDALAEYLRAAVLGEPAEVGTDAADAALDAMSEVDLAARLDATLDALERRLDVKG